MDDDIKNLMIGQSRIEIRVDQIHECVKEFEPRLKSLETSRDKGLGIISILTLVGGAVGAVITKMLK